LDHRPHAHVRRAGRRTDDAGFADGRVDDTVLAEALHQAFRRLEGAAVRPDILAHEEHFGIALHLLGHGLPDRFEVGDFSHRDSPRLPTRVPPARPVSSPARLWESPHRRRETSAYDARPIP